MLIRIITPDDAAAFQALRLRSLIECPSAFASSYEEEAPTPLKTVRGRLAPKVDGAILGGFVSETLSVVVGVQRETMAKLVHKAFIWGLYVVPEARTQGLGAQVLRCALEYAAENLHVQQVNLGVNTTNTAAIALYRKFGFVEYGLARGYLLVNGEAHDEYQMVWRATTAARLRKVCG